MSLFRWAFLFLVAQLCSAQSSCGEFDVTEVRHELKYKGPSQKIHRDGKLNFRCFNAQHWEDLYMFQNYFGNVTSGFFIELGALDGWSYSVSYFFEQFLGWKGLLIEASPKNYLQFKSKMKKLSPKRRRKSEFILSAVCNDPKPLTYVSKEGTGAGILEFMPEDQQIRNRKMCVTAPPVLQKADDDNSAAIAVESHRGSCTLTPIQCIHLGDMLRQRGVQKIDMFVLDVEGAELEVLRTLRLNEIPVHFFLIELDGKAPEKDSMVRCILRQNNYEPVGRLDLNEIWKKRDFDVSLYKDTYGPAVPISAWSGCFRGTVDHTFFTGGKVEDIGGEAEKVKAGDNALDEDFAVLEAMDGKQTKDGFYGQAQSDEESTFNSLTRHTFWALIVCVPVVLLVRIRRRRQSAARERV